MAKKAPITENDIVNFVPGTAAPNTVVAIVKTPAERAVAALASTETEVKLRELVLSSADIVAVIDPAGREQAHRIGMTLKNARIAIEKTGKAAREDAVAFGKAVVAEEKRLINLVTDEESRVFKLRDDFDEKVAAEKAEAERIERERIAAIRAKISEIRDLPLRHAHASTTSALLFEVLSGLAKREIGAAEFFELTDEARAAVDLAGSELETMYTAAQKREQEEADRLAEIEAQRVAMEAQAESLRVEAARLAEERRVQAVEDEARRARAASEEAARIRVMEETKRQLDAQAAEIEARRKATEAAAKAESEALLARIAAFEAAQQKEIDHAEAIEEDRAFAAERTKRAESVPAAAEAPPAAPQPDAAPEVVAEPVALLAPDPDAPTELLGESSIDQRTAESAALLRVAVWALLETKTPDEIRAMVEVEMMTFSSAVAA